MALRDWLADAWFWLRSLVGKAPVTAPDAPQGPFRIFLDRDKPVPTTDGIPAMGVMRVADTQFESLERPWLNNEHKVSCVPPGVYKLRLHDWDHEPGFKVYELLDVPNDRSPIDIHPGNTVKDTIGCILLGFHRGVMNGQPAVTESRAAIHTFEGMLAAHTDIELEIR